MRRLYRFMPWLRHGLLFLFLGSAAKANAQEQSKVRLPTGEHVPLIEIKSTTDKSAPLLIGLHGYGMDENQMATLVNPALGFECNYIAIRGFVSLGKGEFAWFPIRETSAGPEINAEDIEESITKLNVTIKALIERYKPSGVYLIGYSQGAGLAYSYAWQALPEIKGIAAFSGTLLNEVSGSFDKPLPFFTGHGNFDSLISQEEILKTKATLEAAGARVSFHAYNVPHVVSKRGRTDLAAWLGTLIEKK